jgi:hypothetical protein
MWSVWMKTGIVNVHQILMLGFQDEALHRVRFSSRMIEVKRALCFYVVVPSVSQAVVLADEHFGSSAW